MAEKHVRKEPPEVGSCYVQCSFSSVTLRRLVMNLLLTCKHIMHATEACIAVLDGASHMEFSFDISRFSLLYAPHGETTKTCRDQTLLYVATTYV